MQQFSRFQLGAVKLKTCDSINNSGFQCLIGHRGDSLSDRISRIPLDNFCFSRTAYTQTDRHPALRSCKESFRIVTSSHDSQYVRRYLTTTGWLQWAQTGWGRKSTVAVELAKQMAAQMRKQITQQNRMPGSGEEQVVWQGMNHILHIEGISMIPLIITHDES